jgi:hypothetical protein
VVALRCPPPLVDLKKTRRGPASTRSGRTSSPDQGAADLLHAGFGPTVAGSGPVVAEEGPVDCRSAKRREGRVREMKT